jgi:tetratricopeptide (TPR) repeat protein
MIRSLLKIKAIGDPFLCLLFASTVAFVPFVSKPPQLEAQSIGAQETGDRFDVLVRADFFAGMLGDKRRLDRGMKACEDALAKNPKHAEALVWHGGGLIARASQAYRLSDSATGERLWKQGIDEMNRAVIFDPNDIGVKIGRAATLIGLAQSGWDPHDSEARSLLESAVKDYEQVYEIQKPQFDDIRMHSRGELLFGLASGWSMLGNQAKTKEYLETIIAECQKTPYESEAKRWLNKKPPFVVQHDCTGCHISSYQE